MNIGEFLKITKGTTKAPRTIQIKNILYDDCRFVKEGDFFWVRDKPGYNARTNVAIKRGARGIIVPRTLLGKIAEKKHLHYIYVDRSMVFKYSQYNRNLCTCPVIGVTGSAGKTTTKNMLAQILRTQGRVISTIASINAVCSAPFYAMKMKPQDKYGVFEMGMKGLGQIRTMASYYQPTIGIITNIGDAHIGKLGNSINNIVKAKQEIIGKIRKNGYLILNADNPYTKKLDLSKFKGKKIVYVGIHNNADFKASDLKYRKNSTSFKVRHKNITYNFTVASIGEHNVYNALAAISASFILKVPYNRIQERLAVFKNSGMRTQVLKGFNQSTIISDAFNANPTAAIEGMKAMKLIAGGKPMIAVIGEISEQGAHTIVGHRKIGKKAADMGIQVVGVGPYGKHVIEGSKQSKTKVRTYHANNKNDAVNYLKRTLQPGTYAYFKASRDFRMETLIYQLIAKRKAE